MTRLTYDQFSVFLEYGNKRKRMNLAKRVNKAHTVAHQITKARFNQTPKRPKYLHRASRNMFYLNVRMLSTS